MTSCDPPDLSCDSKLYCLIHVFKLVHLVCFRFQTAYPRCLSRSYCDLAIFNKLSSIAMSSNYSFFDTADFAYWNELGVSLLGCYITIFVTYLTVLGAVAYQWKKLPYVFKYSAFASTTCILFGFGTCLLYLTTLHTAPECYAGRKVFYISHADRVFLLLFGIRRL